MLERSSNAGDKKPNPNRNKLLPSTRTSLPMNLPLFLPSLHLLPRYRTPFSSPQNLSKVPSMSHDKILRRMVQLPDPHFLRRLPLHRLLRLPRLFSLFLRLQKRILRSTNGCRSTNLRRNRFDPLPSIPSIGTLKLLNRFQHRGSTRCRDVQYHLSKSRLRLPRLRNQSCKTNG